MVASPTEPRPDPPTRAPGPDDASRARLPDATGELVRDGVRIAWDRYGPAEPVGGQPTILLTPTWSIIHSRFWKLQIPYLARHYRVVTWDGRGNGRSDRPGPTDAYADAEFAADGLAVLDATDTRRAVVVGLSAGARWTLLLAARQPARVAGAVFIAPSLPLRPKADPAPNGPPFDAILETYEGWDRYNRHSWRRDYPGFLEFFFGRCFTEPHSTKPIEDCIGWAHETTAETLIRTQDAANALHDRQAVLDHIERVACPGLVIQGTEDDVVTPWVGEELARRLGCELVELEGTGHIPCVREPVKVNLEIRRFVRSIPEAAW